MTETPEETQRVLHDALVAIRDNGPKKRHAGICCNIAAILLAHYQAVDAENFAARKQPAWLLLKHLISRWALANDRPNTTFPIELCASTYCENIRKWHPKTEFGRLRLQLLGWLITETEHGVHHDQY